MEPSQREIAISRVLKQLTAALKVAAWCRRNDFDRWSIHMMTSDVIEECIEALAAANAAGIETNNKN